MALRAQSGGVIHTLVRLGLGCVIVRRYVTYTCLPWLGLSQSGGMLYTLVRLGLGCVIVGRYVIYTCPPWFGLCHSRAVCYIHLQLSYFVWAVSQHIDTSKNTNATLKCCYAPNSYVGTIFSHNMLFGGERERERERDREREIQREREREKERERISGVIPP